MVYDKRVDANQKLVADWFRGGGAIVDYTSTVGRGFPDLVINYHGFFCLVEVKSSEEATYTKPQVEWHAKHYGMKFTVKSHDDVINVLAVIDEWCKKLRFAATNEFEIMMKEAMHVSNHRRSARCRKNDNGKNGDRETECHGC
jgi:hypothetical protein